MVATNMLSSFLHSSQSRRRQPNRPNPQASQHSPSPSPVRTRGSNPFAFHRDQDLDQETADQADGEEERSDHGESALDVKDEDCSSQDEDGEDQPLLPIFSAELLDALPVYNLAHAIKVLVEGRCETTLSWDQLRSPQVSQFLLKPIQQELRTEHLSRATIYALMANCLQFNKEIGLHPGISGTSKTRAMVCELLAIKLLKEFTPRELIDVLSYDFNPLQGQDTTTMVSNSAAVTTSNGQPTRKAVARVSRISCLEIAIRAQAKRFLAHPLVVRQLEAIWAGSIVFHSAADDMHRPQSKKRFRGYGTVIETFTAPQPIPRRSVTLYNPKDASLFKLSRLRVPRYRNLLSTLSFAVLLGLFLAVLIERSPTITPLELVFWFWTAGYMLDEIVTFNEQGFSLYLASFWNTFDLGILLLLLLHLVLRLYGVFLGDDRKMHIANMAYDVLAANAVLLFPRLFSVLDHYKYFSQLLIAFRMMAVDLAAVFILILISCSGFFVALTLSLGKDKLDSPGGVAYALLQMLMGFTPAAWDRWDKYNLLGKLILTLFLFICHFLVVTILITVLTNSFMEIVRNANEEHQFVFAINTLSMVKSDALFAYVAPTNVIAWAVMPVRYIIPFKQYIKLNRTIIKATHFPILFSIFLYEKTILSLIVVDPVDIVDRRGRASNRRLFTQKQSRLAREPSIATYRQDRALEEVFKKPAIETVRAMQKSQDRRSTSNVVSNWMHTMASNPLSPPQEQDRTVVDKLENRRSVRRRGVSSRSRRNLTARSVLSDPEEFMTNDFLTPDARRITIEDRTPSNVVDMTQQTDGDGDDELVTSEADDEDRLTLNEAGRECRHVAPADYFSRKPVSRPNTAQRPETPGSANKSRFTIDSSSGPASRHESPTRMPSPERRTHHLRNVSSATVVYKPEDRLATEQTSRLAAPNLQMEELMANERLSASGSGARTPISKPTSSAAGRKTPKKSAVPPVRTRPIMPPIEHSGFQSAPNIAGLTMFNPRARPGEQRKGSTFLPDIGSDIGDNKAAGGGYVGALPASFGTQMAYRMNTRLAPAEDQEMLSRLVMARMNTLEEGFREVVHEMRENLRKAESRSRSREGARSGRHTRPHSRNRREKTRERDRDDFARQKALRQTKSKPPSPKPVEAEHKDWEDLENNQDKTGTSV